MDLLKYPLILLWRIWFYILAAIPIIVLLPLVMLSVLKEKWYPFFFKLMRFWAVFILFGMGFIPKIKRNVRYEKGKSYIFIANHTSMTDVMLMLYLIKNPFVFVGKKELMKLPIIGYFYKKTSILVDRGDFKSRKDVYPSAQKRLERGLSLCIFPEGKVPDDESIVLDSFKNGAFRLSTDYDIPLAPLTFHDNKKRFSYTFFSGSPGKMRVTIHPIMPYNNDFNQDPKHLKEQIRNLILNELEHPTA